MPALVALQAFRRPEIFGVVDVHVFGFRAIIVTAAPGGVLTAVFVGS
jgi:hypothetical protein